MPPRKPWRTTSHGTPAARADSSWPRVRRMVARYRVASLRSGLAMVALLIGTGLAVWHLHSARTEAQRATLAFEFMVGLFEPLYPQHATGKTPTALDLLDTGAGKIKKTFAQDPLLTARLHLHFGDVYYELGCYQETVQQFNRSVALLEAQSDTPSKDYVQTLTLRIESLKNLVTFDPSPAAVQRVRRLAQDGLSKATQLHCTDNRYVVVLLEDLG